MMKIVTWNINGIRSTKDPLKVVLDSLDADIICLQETKITRDQLESDIALIDGYVSFFSYSQTRQGYSGVATYCRKHFSPFHAVDCLHCIEDKQDELFSQAKIKELNQEGRTVITEHEIKNNDKSSKLAIINVYCPRADPEKEDRKQFKLDFYSLLEACSKEYLNNNYSVIILGDVNTSHRQIDHCDPNDPMLFYDNPGRLWLDSFLYNKGDYSKLKEIHDTTDISDDITPLKFIDSFRYFYPKKRQMFTCWCTSNRARQTNYGTRIDYIFVNVLLRKYLQSCEIMADFMGSDHCPVYATFNVEVIASKKLPILCTCYLVEFGQKQQQKLSLYFNKNNFTKKGLSMSVENQVYVQPSKRKRTEISCGKPKKLGKKINKQSTLSHFVKKSNNLEKSMENKVISKPTENVKIKKSNSNSAESVLFWKSILKGPDPPPLCTGHNEPSILRTVKKEGPNLGRQFYCCSRPEGHKTNKEANCQYFEWKKKK